MIVDRNISLEELAEKKDGLYSAELLEALKAGHHEYLFNVPADQKGNIFFMEPLLYAFKNSPYGTYKIYKYYGDNLKQEDVDLAVEILNEEPNVLKETVATEDPTLVLKIAEKNPKIALYMSEKLKNDGEFIEDLCKIGNREAIAYAIDKDNAATLLRDNPELANNPEFMREAIKEDVTILGKAPEEFRNSYEFMRDITKTSREAIDYVVENTDKFGKEAITATRESLVENIEKDVHTKIEEELAKVRKEVSETEAQTLSSDEINPEQKSQEELEKIQASIDRIFTKYNTYTQEVENGTRDPKTLIRFINTFSKVEGIPEDIKSMMAKTKILWEAEIEKTATRTQPATLQDRLAEMQKNYQELIQAAENGTRKPEDVISFINIQLNLFKEMPDDIRKNMEQAKAALEAESKAEKGLEEIKHIEGKANGENSVEYDAILNITESLKLNEITEEPKAIREEVKKVERISEAVKAEVKQDER